MKELGHFGRKCLVLIKTDLEAALSEINEIMNCDAKNVGFSPDCTRSAGIEILSALMHAIDLVEYFEFDDRPYSSDIGNQLLRKLNDSEAAWQKRKKKKSMALVPMTSRESGRP